MDIHEQKLLKKIAERTGHAAPASVEYSGTLYQWVRSDGKTGNGLTNDEWTACRLSGEASGSAVNKGVASFRKILPMDLATAKWISESAAAQGVDTKTWLTDHGYDGYMNTEGGMGRGITMIISLKPFIPRMTKKFDNGQWTGYGDAGVMECDELERFDRVIEP